MLACFFVYNFACSSPAQSPSMSADRSLPRTTRSAPEQSKETSHPFDPYPGFGRSEHAALRDDAIAAWESFRRDLLVVPCMAKHGFSYWPEVLYPAMTEVANFLRISIPKTAPTAGIVKNGEYVTGLSESDRDRYAFAKWGETSRDEHTSVFPEDVGESPKEFPRGGCHGKADKEIPGVWTTKRALDDELDEINHALNRAHPIGSRDEQYAIDRRELEQTFVRKHSRVLEAVRMRYEGVVDRIRADDAFIESLRQHVVYARSQP